ncbi:type IV pilus twitching motility protein PilT [Patescibacteria group bacterium]
MDKNDNAFKELLLAVVEAGGSDLHLSVGRHPTIRVAGSLVPLVKKPILTPDIIDSFLVLILSEEQRAELEKNGEVDFAYSTKNEIRFRCNAFRQRNNYGMAMRLVPNEIGTFEELGLPDVLKSFALKQQGFFLVVGPAGHGKSTTLASMVKIINSETSQHIVTIEDPIEYLFTQDKSIIDQREVGHDTSSFKKGLRSMFRQDVDVAMIGEMRDTESIGIAVTAAETGHLILSSLHTNNASQTIDRIIDSFPAAQQNQTRLQLAGSLLGIFSQRLIPRLSGGLIPAYELLIANTAVRNLIRERRTHELDIVIETSSSDGMISLNTTLLNLVRDGEIGMDDALAYSLDPKALSGLSS